LRSRRIPRAVPGRRSSHCQRAGSGTPGTSSLLVLCRSPGALARFFGRQLSRLHPPRRPLFARSPPERTAPSRTDLRRLVVAGGGGLRTIRSSRTVLHRCGRPGRPPPSGRRRTASPPPPWPVCTTAPSVEESAEEKSTSRNRSQEIFNVHFSSQCARDTVSSVHGNAKKSGTPPYEWQPQPARAQAALDVSLRASLGNCWNYPNASITSS
jgi:hypothetical protein